MKWLSQAIFVLYGLMAIYFIYTAVMGIFVYFANKSMGHYEMFLVPGRNLCFGFMIAGIAIGAWYLIHHSSYQKIGYVILYLPLIIIGGFFIFMFINLLSSGGRWN